MEVTHDCKVSSSKSSQKLDSEIQEICDLFGTGSKMLGRLTKCKRDTSFGANDIQCTASMEDGDVSNTKSTPKRSFETFEEICGLQVNDGSCAAPGQDILQQESTVLCSGIHLFNEKIMGNKHISNEDEKIETSDHDKMLNKNVAAEDSELSETSEVGTRANKMHKLDKKTEGYTNGKKAMVSGFSKEASTGGNVIDGSTMDGELETTTATNDGLSVEPQEDNLIENNSNCEKKKRLPIPHHNLAPAVPISMGNGRGGSSMRSLEPNWKDSTKECDDNIISQQSIQDSMQFEPCSISARQTNSGTLHEGEASSELLKKKHTDIEFSGAMPGGFVHMDIYEADSRRSGRGSESSRKKDSISGFPEKSQPSDQGETEINMKEVAENKTVNNFNLSVNEETNQMDGNVLDLVKTCSVFPEAHCHIKTSLLETMVSDSQIVTRLQVFLRSSDLNTTTNASVRRKLEEDLAIDLSGKKAFVKEQIDLFLQEDGHDEQDNEGQDLLVETMVSDLEIVTRLREFLCSSDLNTVTNASVRRKLEEDSGIILSDRKAFIREQIDLFLDSQLKTAA